MNADKEALLIYLRGWGSMGEFSSKQMYIDSKASSTSSKFDQLLTELVNENQLLKVRRNTFKLNPNLFTQKFAIYEDAKEVFEEIEEEEEEAEEEEEEEERKRKKRSSNKRSPNKRSSSRQALSLLSVNTIETSPLRGGKKMKKKKTVMSQLDGTIVDDKKIKAHKTLEYHTKNYPGHQYQLVEPIADLSLDV